jgi:hypothetical protein
MVHHITVGLKKSKFISFIVFMQHSPMTFTGVYLFGELDRIGKLALMGAIQPSEDFTGKIEAEALTESEIHGATKKTIIATPDRGIFHLAT